MIFGVRQLVAAFQTAAFQNAAFQSAVLLLFKSADKSAHSKDRILLTWAVHHYIVHSQRGRSCTLQI